MRTSSTPRPITLERHNGIIVLRDDHLPGGSKSRFIDQLIPPGTKEVVYASPVYGGFQIALAAAAARLGIKATIFCAKRKEMHANTKQVQRHGGNVIQVPYGYLTNIEAKAKAYCQKTGAHKLKFGADYPEAINSLAETMRRITKEIGKEPDEVWCAWGSGTLTRGIIAGTDKAKINAVVVGMDPSSNDVHPRLTFYRSGFTFDKPYKGPHKPPFPSTPNYDAKAWAKLQEKRPPGMILFWNVL